MYEQIPDIMINVVRSIYRTSYVDANLNAPARVLDFFETRMIVGDVRMLLNQIGIIVTVLLMGVMFYIWYQKRALKARGDSGVTSASSTFEPAAEPVTVGVLRPRWDAVLAHLDTPHESQWKMAVVEADKLVDDALARAGFAGATFGDRLSNIQPGTLLSLDGVWWAHKIRNRIAHEMDYFLRYTEARQALAYYEAALSELQLL